MQMRFCLHTSDLGNKVAGFSDVNKFWYTYLGWDIAFKNCDAVC